MFPSRHGVPVLTPVLLLQESLSLEGVGGFFLLRCNEMDVRPHDWVHSGALMVVPKVHVWCAGVAFLSPPCVSSGGRRSWVFFALGQAYTRCVGVGTKLWHNCVGVSFCLFDCQ